MQYIMKIIYIAIINAELYFLYFKSLKAFFVNSKKYEIPKAMKPTTIKPVKILMKHES